MIIAVIGSRSFKEEQLFCTVMEEYTPTELISGDGDGADRLAAKWAKTHRVPFTKFVPDFKRYGRAAPVWRNNLLVNAAEMVIAFWDGNSEGTKYIIDLAKIQGKNLKVVMF